MHRYARAAVALGMLVAAGPAIAQSIVSPRTGGAATVSSTAKPLPGGADVAAMAAASRESLFIMRASFAARTKGGPAVRETASNLIAYHTQALSDYRGALQAAALTPPPVSLTAEQQRRLAALEATSGAAFDSLFISEVRASQAKASQSLLAHGKTKGNLIVTAQANRQGNQIAALNAKTK